MKKSICKICGNEFVMGYTGILKGCDACLEIVRDESGYFWLPDETEHVYQNVGEEDTYVVTREVAFEGKSVS